MIRRFKKVTGFHSGLIIIFLKIAGASEFASSCYSDSSINVFLLLELEDLLPTLDGLFIIGNKLGY